MELDRHAALEARFGKQQVAAGGAAAKAEIADAGPDFVERSADTCRAAGGLQDGKRDGLDLSWPRSAGLSIMCPLNTTTPVWLRPLFRTAAGQGLEAAARRDRLRPQPRRRSPCGIIVGETCRRA
jgi:hypothetical protein